MRAVSIAKIDYERRQFFRVERIEQVRVVVEPTRCLLKILAQRMARIRGNRRGSCGSEGERVTFIAWIKIDDECVKTFASNELIE